MQVRGDEFVRRAKNVAERGDVFEVHQRQKRKNRYLDGRDFRIFDESEVHVGLAKTREVMQNALRVTRGRHLNDLVLFTERRRSNYQDMQSFIVGDGDWHDEKSMKRAMRLLWEQVGDTGLLTQYDGLLARYPIDRLNLFDLRAPMPDPSYLTGMMAGLQAYFGTDELVIVSEESMRTLRPDLYAAIDENRYDFKL